MGSGEERVKAEGVENGVSGFSNEKGIINGTEDITEGT